MSNTRKKTTPPARQIAIRSILRKNPDLHAFARAIISIAEEELRQEKQAKGSEGEDSRRVTGT